jgi:amino acid permease
MTPDDLFAQVFSRERILEGDRPPTRRANTLLFHVESRTAHLVGRSQVAMQKFLTEEAARERDLAFIDAFNLGAAPPLTPTIQDIERFARQWAALVPDNAALKAALAHQLGQKYRFAATAVPQLRSALVLDSPAVQDAYQRFYQTSLGSIYADELSLRERVVWTWSRLGTWLENLPPFWAVFSLTLTEVVGASILALPIALASVGPLPSLVLLLVFGLMNVLTVAHMAETASRSGGIRYGSAFLGQVVDDYLGRTGSLILSIGLFALIILVLLAFYIGFATAIAEPTQIPAAIWVALLFGAGLYYVTRGSLNATVTSSLVIGAINLSLIVILMLLAAPHIEAENLTYFNLPLVGGRPFDPSVLELIFGVVLASYFGHLSVPNSARTVLQRDPSGGSLVRGAMAAQGVVILLYSIWILIVNGAIAPGIMAVQTGTALEPLAAEVGPIVYPFGTIFVILGMGMITIHFSLGLFNLTREWLPQRQQPALTLPRRQGRLHLHPRHRPAGLPQVGLVYLGLEEEGSRFRLDIQSSAARRYVEVSIRKTWTSAELLAQDSELAADTKLLSLTIEVLEANAQWARVRLTTPLSVQYEAGRDTVGLSMSHVLLLPETQAQLVIWLIREGSISLEAAARHLEQPPEAARDLLADLANQGFVQEVEANGRLHYEPRLSSTRSHRLSYSLLEAVSDGAAGTPASKAASQQVRQKSAFQQLLDRLLSERGRFVLGLAPMVVIFLAAEALLLTGNQSFSEPLSFIGVVVIAMLGGIYPVLLLRAGRQKGEIVPDVVYRVIGNQVLLIVIYVLSLTGVILHGLVIWDDPLRRILALLVATVIVAVTINSWRQGAFVPRLVVEVGTHEEEGRPAHLSVTAGGEPYAAGIQLIFNSGTETSKSANSEIVNFATLQQVIVTLPAGVAPELKVWTYIVSPGSTAKPLPVLAEVRMEMETVEIDLNLTGGQVLLPLNNRPAQLTLTFPQDK